jgi:ferredoxin
MKKSNFLFIIIGKRKKAQNIAFYPKYKLRKKYIPICRYLKRNIYLCIINIYGLCAALLDYTKTLLTIKNKNIMAYVIGEDCVACGTCIDECPVGAISEGDIYKINPDECTECGTCASVCPNQAISLAE